MPSSSDSSSGAPWPLQFLVNPKQSFYFLISLLWMLSLPFFALLSLPAYILALAIAKFDPKYGKFISYFDAWLEEDFVSSIPRNTIVTSLLIQGDLSLAELRSLFTKNVLEARSHNPQKARYPELRQYLTRLLGFGIWRNDDIFQVENHILERSSLGGTNTNFEAILASVHQELQNLPYQKNRSPWEMILIRNAGAPSQSLLALKTQHILADAKSLLKLCVECLGEKELKSATPLCTPEASWLSKLSYYPLYIPNFLVHMSRLALPQAKSHFHPWKVTEHWKDGDIKTVLAFTPNLPFADVKKIAKRNGVTCSAVLMSIVAGGIRKCGEALRRTDVSIGYSLPKPNHPEVLTNHLYMGFLNLPTDQADVDSRLRSCNENFVAMRSSEQGRYLNLLTILGGSQIFPLTRLAINHYSPVGITNIAGEMEEVFIGRKGHGQQVVDFRMSVGTQGGAAGVVFCAFSYTDGIRITVVAKENILGREQVEKLAVDISKELRLLTCI